VKKKTNTKNKVTTELDFLFSYNWIIINKVNAQAYKETTLQKYHSTNNY